MVGTLLISLWLDNVSAPKTFDKEMLTGDISSVVNIQLLTAKSCPKTSYGVLMETYKQESTAVLESYYNWNFVDTTCTPLGEQ